MLFARARCPPGRKAGTLFKLGNEIFDASLVDLTNTYVSKATYQLTRALAASEGLIAKYGPPCG